jgi:hypothetical protein
MRTLFLQHEPEALATESQGKSVANASGSLCPLLVFFLRGPILAFVDGIIPASASRKCQSDEEQQQEKKRAW